MDPKSEISDTEFPPSGQIGRTEKQLSFFTDISCDQDNPLKRPLHTLHKRNEEQEKEYTNLSDSKKILEKTDFSVLPDEEDTEMVLNKCSRLLFDIAPRAVDRVLLNKYIGSPKYLFYDLHKLRFKIIEMESYGLDEIDYLNIKEVLSEKDEYMSVEEIIKDLTLSTKILLLFGHRRWYFISRYGKSRILEDSETGVEDDLLKIEYYYSWLLCVNKQNLAKTELCFMWNLITKAVVRIGGSEFKTEIENLASSQTCDPFKIPDKHTQKQVNNPREPALNDALKHDHSKIHEASMFGHCDEVKELLQNGADANERNNALETPLYISAKHGHLDVVKELLKNGADTNKWECTGATPLYISAKHGHLDVVKELLQNGANTNKCNDTGATPLYISAMHGHLDVVKELLQNGADTNKCYISGDTPLNVAFKHDHHDVVEVLLENKTDRNIKAVDDNYEADVYRKTSNVEKSVLKQKASLKGELTCDQSEIERIQKIFNKIDISVPTTNRQFVVPTGKMFHIYFIHSSDPSDTLWVETTIKTIQNHGFKCCGGLSKIMNEQSFEKIKTDSCVLCLVLTRYFMEEAGKECIEILKSQQCKVLAIQLSEYKETDFQFENVTTIDARDFAEKQIEWFQELLEYLKKTDLQNVNVIANEMFNCEPSTAFRVTSCVADAEPIDILIHTDKVEKPIITDILQNRVKITNPKLVSKESGVINAMILIKAWLCSFMGFVWKISGSNTDFWLRRIKPSLFTESCRGNISGIRYFLDVKRANINDKDGLVGLSPLHLAAINGHYRVVDFLLNREADPNVKADSACYPYLLEYTKDDLNLYFGDCKDASALRLAILFDQDLCVKILLKKGWKMSIEELSICTKISERNKKIEQIFLQYLADNIIQKYSDLKFEVRFCYKPGPPNERIIMCYTNDVYDVINDNYLGVTIRIQNPNIIDDEDSIIFETEPTNNYIIDQKTLSLMEKVIQCNGDRLFESHSNLNIITVSAATLSKKGGVTKGPCIVLYCTTKDVIPLNEEPFPHFLYWNQEKVVTDIREGYFSLCPGGVAERDWNNPLRSGASIGIRGDESQEATMGPFVQLRDGSLGFITCAHLFNTVQNDLKTFVVQPSYTVLSTDGVTKEDKDCGFLVRKIFEPRREVSIDAAVVKITSRIPNRGCFAFNSIFQLQEAGFDRVNYPVFDSGSVKKEINPEDTPKIIIKFGSNTGLTRGAFRLNGVQVRVKRKINLTTPINPQTFTMKGQYEIQSVGPKDFFQPGDSGSGVYIVDENKQLHCIGIAIGCTSYRSTIVTPIKDVLEALDLPSKLKTFKPENMQH